jgi:hypothetical protein
MNRRNSAALVFFLVMTIAISVSETRPDSGSVEGNRYKSDFFGFTYSFPKGWVRLQQQSQSGIRLAPEAALYTLLFATASPSTGTISPANAGIVVLAEDISHSGIRDSKGAAGTLARVLTSTQPPHSVPHPAREVTLGGSRFTRLDYEQQTFSQVKHYFCSVITVKKGYAIRFSVIADSKARMEKICSTTESITFGKDDN